MTDPHGARAHSYISPSAFERIILCPGSLKANEGIPEGEPSEEAAEGTRAHELAEEWLRLDMPPLDMTDEQREAVGFYVDACLSLPGRHLIEQRLSLNGIAPLRGQYGLCDHIALHDGTLTVSDLKYGQGVIVDAFQNKQLACYAFAAALEYYRRVPINDVVCRIIQPRRQHVSEWKLTISELGAFVDAVRPDVGRALYENPLRIPGAKQCQFCRFAPQCPEKNYDAANAIINMEHAEDLPLTEKARLASREAIISSSIKAWKADIRANLELDPDSVPGWTLKAGRRTRSWEDDDLVRKTLGKRAYQPAKMITPAQAEKLTEWIALKDNVAYTQTAGSVQPV